MRGKTPHQVFIEHMGDVEVYVVGARCQHLCVDGAGDDVARRQFAAGW